MAEYKAVGHVSKHRFMSSIYHAIAFGNPGMEVALSPDPQHKVVVGHFRNKNLKYIDFKGFRYVEQNPKSTSAYAKRACQGSRIVWIIRLVDDAYVGYIENGEAYRKVVYPAQAG